MDQIKDMHFPLELRRHDRWILLGIRQATDYYACTQWPTVFSMWEISRIGPLFSSCMFCCRYVDMVSNYDDFSLLVLVPWVSVSVLTLVLWPLRAALVYWSKNGHYWMVNKSGHGHGQVMEVMHHASLQ